MSGYLLGIKRQMEQSFNEAGVRLPVTYIDIDNCYLIGAKIKEKDGYCSIILGCGLKHKIKKPVAGQLKKVNIDKAIRYIREIRLNDDALTIVTEDKKEFIKLADKKFSSGQLLSTTDMFVINDIVNVTGTSKGKGFAGVVKRHHFAGGPKTHGQSDRERAPGSIGQSTTPGRVYKGKRMAGRMGGERVTIKNLSVIGIKDNQLIVKGGVPGAQGSLLIIKSVN